MSPNNIQLINCLDNIINTNPNLFINEESEYYFKGHKIPRVTSMLSRGIHNDSLMDWANYIGRVKHQNYGTVMNKSLNIGSQTHECIDYFFHNNAEVSNYTNLDIEARQAYLSFSKWYRDINSTAQIELIYNEHPLISKYYGGTLDALMKFNGRIFLIDFKTSNSIRINYALQVAAYAILLEMVENIQIDGCLVLQLSKTSIGYNEYIIDLANPEQNQYFENCKNSFLSLALWYYNLALSEAGYSNILEWDKKRW